MFRHCWSLYDNISRWEIGSNPKPVAIAYYLRILYDSSYPQHNYKYNEKKITCRSERSTGCVIFV